MIHINSQVQRLSAVFALSALGIFVARRMLVSKQQMLLRNSVNGKENHIDEFANIVKNWRKTSTTLNPLEVDEVLEKEILRNERDWSEEYGRLFMMMATALEEGL